MKRHRPTGSGTSSSDGPRTTSGLVEARWRRYLRLRRDHIEQDIDDELSFHREMRERDFEHAGLPPEQARAAADARLGDLDEVRHWLTRHDRRRIRRMAMGESLMEIFGDVRYALRKLGLQPGFTAAVVAVLALGTGATTAIFSAVDAVLFRPLPFADAERLAIVDLGVPFDPGAERRRPKGGPDITDARAMGDVFVDVAAYAPGGLNLSDDANPRRVRVGVVTPNLFGILGVAPLSGRVFTTEEEAPGAAPVALLSERIWRGHFGSDADMIGRDVVLNGKAYEVVGIMPRGFEFPESSEIWLPLSVPFTFATMEPFRSYLPSRAVARLASGVTVEQAGQRVFALHAPYATPGEPVEAILADAVRPFRDALVGQRRTALVVLLGATAMVLLVACANVANLLLSRATMRRREIALRAALGATPGRVLRQLGVESLVLALAGAGAGVALSFGAIRALDVLVPASLSGVAPLRIDGRVLAFSLAVALVTGLLFGLWPALEGRRSNPGDALKTGSPGAGGGRSAKLRRAFVVGEVAVALMLLVGSTLMLRSLHELMGTESGVDPEGVATLELTLAATDHPGPDGRRRFYQDVLARLSADPRVEAAAAINELPMRGVEGIQLMMRPEGRAPESIPEDAPYSQLIRITPDYFRVMDVRLLAGRAPLPTAAEDGSADGPTREVAISETLARLYWPDRYPIGERLDWPGGKFEIVGIVADVRPTTLESDFIPQAYTAMLDSPDTNAALVLRGSGRGDPAELEALLQDAVHAVAPRQAVYNVRTMDRVIEGAISSRRTNTFLISAFGGLALALAAVGVYGVMAFSVSRRTREIGVRIALGARPERVMASVLREGLSLALIGTALGMGGAWALSRVMSGMLYGVTTRDPVTFVVAPLALLAFAATAAALPAWRATRVNPVEAMRVE